MNLTRAYSLLQIKAVDDDKRQISGMATTPSPDRYGDIVEPDGAKFKNPLPLLWQHQSDKPVGTVRFGKATAEGIPFEARIEKTDEPGTLKERLDEAWQSVKLKLVRGVSIGFRALETAYMQDTGGIRFIATEILELSLVTIPANADATIQTIKSIDTAQRAALGQQQRAVVRLESSTPPGATGQQQTKPKRKETQVKKPIEEQISEFEAKRAANLAQMNDLTEKAAAEGRTLNDEESETFDGLETENENIDKHLPRLKSLKAANVAGAAEVKGATQTQGSQTRAPHVVQLKQNLLPGIGFARYARCVALSDKSRIPTLQMSKSLYPDMAHLHSLIEKTAVSAGSTVDGNWAANLVGDETAVFADFVEYLRPQTIVGKFGTGNVPDLRRVPFRVPLVGQTGGGSAAWVGEGKAKPLTSLGFNRRTLTPTKVANIAVLTEEVLRSSSPSAEMIIRDALADAIRERLDIDFINPDKNAVADVSPASITNGLSAIGSSGTTADSVREDIAALWGVFIAANLAPSSAVYIMSSTTALALSLMVNALGQDEFPGMTMTGGTLKGIPVIVSDYVPSDSHGPLVILVNAKDIYLADEGGIDIALSREASLEMSDAPAHNSTTPTAAQLVSMFQTNSVAFRAERTINWARRRDAGVALLQGVLWGQGS